MAKISLALWFYCLLSLQVPEASEACSGVMRVEEPIKPIKSHQECSNEYSFNKIDVVFCQAKIGKPTLHISIKDNIGTPVFLKKILKDSYYISPYLFTLGKAECADILAVDHGAEFSYGSMIFIIENNKIIYAGMIDLVANQSGDSIIPNLSVSQDEAGTIKFIFDSDTYRPSKEGYYSKLPKNSILYIYDKIIGLRMGKMQ